MSFPFTVLSKTTGRILRAGKVTNEVDVENQARNEDEFVLPVDAMGLDETHELDYENVKLKKMSKADRDAIQQAKENHRKLAEANSPMMGDLLVQYRKDQIKK